MRSVSRNGLGKGFLACGAKGHRFGDDVSHLGSAGEGLLNVEVERFKEAVVFLEIPFGDKHTND
jgi:hypothetical protein